MIPTVQSPSCPCGALAEPGGAAVNDANSNPPRRPPWSGAEYLRDLFGRDPGGALAVLHDDIRWIVPGDSTFGGGTHVGREAVVKFFGAVLELFPEGLAIEEMHAWPGSDGTVVEAVLTGTTRAGHPYRNFYAFVLEVVDGRVREVREYADTSYAEDVLNREATS